MGVVVDKKYYHKLTAQQQEKNRTENSPSRV